MKRVRQLQIVCGELPISHQIYQFLALASTCNLACSDAGDLNFSSNFSHAVDTRLYIEAQPSTPDAHV